ncbi:MAG: YggS family pyridoxal phosphate-dependent enzyme [Bacillota bacterium]
MSQIIAQIEHIRNEIRAAQNRSPYASKDVLLLAVTKNVDVDRIKAAIGAGLTALGENRVQEIMQKYDKIPDHISWHLIGHLQTNKVKYIIDKVSLIHSLDSVNLAKEINKRAQKAGRVMPVLVQVNVADEETKFGLPTEDTVDFIKEVKDMPYIKISGLMTIGPLVADEEEVRPIFKELRLLRDKIKQMELPGVAMDYLSMGMTNDYRVAVEEGSNIVRIGSAIFGARTN